jgi:hypothetical protein
MGIVNGSGAKMRPVDRHQNRDFGRLGNRRLILLNIAVQ